MISLHQLVKNHCIRFLVAQLRISTMRFLSAVSGAQLLLVGSWLLVSSLVSSYSLNDDALLRRQLGQKSIVDQTLRMATTRRETIRMMPTQTPMVPYKVHIMFV